MCVCMQWNLILERTFSPEQVDIDGFVEQLCGIVYGGRLTTTNETKSNEHANFANCKRWRTRYQADPSSVSAISIPKCSKYTYQAACSSCLRRARWPLTEKRLLFRVSSASVWEILCQQQAADGNLFDLWKEADTVLYWIKLVSVEPWNGPGFLCFGDLIKTELSQIDKALHNCSATTEQPIEIHETATCQPGEIRNLLAAADIYRGIIWVMA